MYDTMRSHRWINCSLPCLARHRTKVAKVAQSDSLRAKVHSVHSALFTMASPAFKRPADPLPHPAKRAATGPAGGDETADELRRALERQQKDYKAREAALLIRLSRKESEVQNLLSELQSLAPLLHPDSTNLTSKLLDPALQTLHVALRASLAEKDAKIAKLSEELAAREFTPQSVIGKRVVGRLKALQAENEELGKLVYGGRMEALEVELGLAKKVAMEAKNSLLGWFEGPQDVCVDVVRLTLLLLALCSNRRQCVNNGP